MLFPHRQWELLPVYAGLLGDLGQHHAVIELALGIGLGVLCQAKLGYQLVTCHQQRLCPRHNGLIQACMGLLRVKPLDLEH